MALPNYNLGVIEAKEGNIGKALEKFKLAVTQIEDTKKGDKERTCAALVALKISDMKGQLEFQEVKDPDILETAQSAISVIEKLSNNI